MQVFRKKVRRIESEGVMKFTAKENPVNQNSVATH
jgi:hypothetical protein